MDVLHIIPWEYKVLALALLGGSRAYAHVSPTRKMNVFVFHFRRRRRRCSRCPSVHLVFLGSRSLRTMACCYHDLNR